MVLIRLIIYLNYKKAGIELIFTDMNLCRFQILFQGYGASTMSGFGNSGNGWPS